MQHADRTVVSWWGRHGWHLLLVLLMSAFIGVMGGKALASEICWGDDPFVTSPTPELYDGADNDCDGAVDEGISDFTTSVVQVALVQAEPDERSLGETSVVTALVRVTLNTEFASAELRTGAGDWESMSHTILDRTSGPKDTQVEATTAPFDTAGDVDVCVRATDQLGAVSDPHCLVVAVTAPPVDDPVVSFDGFSAPIDMEDQPSVMRAGRTVPLKFALLDGSEPVTDPSTIRLYSVPLADGCTGNPSGAVEAAGAGRSGLRYDADDEQFVLAWKTLRSWAGTCRSIEVEYDDEIVGTAQILFSR